MLTDTQWAMLEPLVEQCRPKGKTPPHDLRRTMEAILWRHENGAKWRAIPGELGPWWKAAQTFIRWGHLGVWERLLELVQERGVALTLSTHGTDQFLVQRLLSARSQREASRGLILSGAARLGDSWPQPGPGAAPISWIAPALVPGVAALERWGLRDALAASGCPPVTLYSFDFGPFTIAGSPRPVDGVDVAYCPRRTVLDTLLVHAAADAGVA